MDGGLTFFQIISPQKWVLFKDGPNAFGQQPVAGQAVETQPNSGGFTDVMRNLLQMMAGNEGGGSDGIDMMALDADALKEAVEDQLESGTPLVDPTGNEGRKEDLLAALIERLRLTGGSVEQAAASENADIPGNSASIPAPSIGVQSGEGGQASKTQPVFAEPLDGVVPTAKGVQDVNGQAPAPGDNAGVTQNFFKTSDATATSLETKAVETKAVTEQMQTAPQHEDAVQPKDQSNQKASDGPGREMEKGFVQTVKTEAAVQPENVKEDPFSKMTGNENKPEPTQVKTDVASDPESNIESGTQDTQKEAAAPETMTRPKLKPEADPSRTVARDTTQGSLSMPKPTQGEQQASKPFSDVPTQDKPADHSAVAAATNTGEEAGGGKGDGQPSHREAMPDTLISRPLADTQGTDHTGQAAKTEKAPSTTDFKTEVIRQIVDQMTLRNAGRQPRMQIRLKPEFLGNLKLQVTTENHQVTVRMTAESTAVKEMIEQNVHVLKHELQQHGLEIQKFDVFVGQQNDNNWRQRQQQEARQQNKTAFADVLGDDDDAVEESSRVSRGKGEQRQRRGSRSEVDFFA